MGKEQYQKYLQSKEWKKLKTSTLKRDEYRCRLCNSNNNIQVHHRLYPEVYGTEPLTDLITLCHKCHKIFHHKTEIKQKAEKRIKRRLYSRYKKCEKELNELFQHAISSGA